MNDGPLGTLSRLRRHEADGARGELGAMNAALIEARARLATLRAAWLQVEQEMRAGRSELTESADIRTLQALEARARAQRVDCARLRTELAEAEAALASLRAAQEGARASFTQRELGARAVERIQAGEERTRMRQHTLRGELEHEDGARFRSRG